MKIKRLAFLVTRVANAKGFENVVSGHVQLPMHTIHLLVEMGYSLQLITTKYENNHALPNCLPIGTTVHQVPYGHRLGTNLAMEDGGKRGIHPIRIIQQLLKIKLIIESEKYDVLHVFGGYRLAYLVSMLRWIGVKVPIVFTLNVGNVPDFGWLGKRLLLSGISGFITSEGTTQKRLSAQGLNAKLAKHGILRDFYKERQQHIEKKVPNRVLFWRDPSLGNGADVCLQVFDELAQKFPDVSFDMAVRPYWKPVPGIHELCKKYSNVNFYEFPYKHGISLSKLLAESICVFLPFRKLSVHPQFSILESMMAGCVVVTTALDSNVDLIQSGVNGFLVPVGDIKEPVKIIERIINDSDWGIKIGQRAAEDARKLWNWDNYLSNLVGFYESLKS